MIEHDFDQPTGMRLFPVLEQSKFGKALQSQAADSFACGPGKELGENRLAEVTMRPFDGQQDSLDDGYGIADRLRRRIRCR